MNAPQEAFEKTVHYILICGAGSLFIVGYNLISAIFRGMGNSKAPLLFVSIACVANIVGDVILIKVFDMGTAGAAIATIAAQAISVVLSLVLIKKKGFPFPFRKENVRLDKGTATSIIKLGFPIALQDMCNEISYLIIIGLTYVLYAIHFCFCRTEYRRRTGSTRKKGDVDRYVYRCHFGRCYVLFILFPWGFVIPHIYKRIASNQCVCRVFESDRD